MKLAHRAFTFNKAQTVCNILFNCFSLLNKIKVGAEKH